MRQFVFGLLVVALMAWGYSKWGQVAAANAQNPVRADLGAMLGAANAAENRGAPEVPAMKPLTAGAPDAEADPLLAACAALIERVAKGEAAAREEAVRVLSRKDLSQDLRQRLEAAVSPKGEARPTAKTPANDKPEDLDGLIAQLGANNDFLRTSEGRDLAQRVLKLIGTLPDDKGQPALTALLERCMRGSITKEDALAREFVDQAAAQLRMRADRFLCDPANLTKARSMTVGKGDSLAAIAARFRKEGVAVDEGTLAILNRIHNPNAIQIGQRIKAPMEPVHAVVEKRSFLLAVYVGDQMLRLYWVGHGADDKTPVTEFTVSDKLANPPWYAPDGKVYAYGDPKNILGKYFIKFANDSYSGFGAHGTPMPETIGTMSSMGCIRMYDKDIEELYKLLPRKAKVEIRDSH